MKRRLDPGYQTAIGGVTYRIVAGKKQSRVAGEIDRRLEAYTSQGWVAVPMAAGAFLAEFFHDNEEVLYPRSQGFEGGRYYVSYIHHAIAQGWEVANQKLVRERTAREERQRQPRPVQQPLGMDSDDADLDAAWDRANDTGEAA